MKAAAVPGAMGSSARVAMSAIGLQLLAVLFRLVVLFTLLAQPLMSVSVAGDDVAFWDGCLKLLDEMLARLLAVLTFSVPLRARLSFLSVSHLPKFSRPS
ncbi:MAG TPA: hypothetical protein VIF32_14725 [Gemmatimonadaceae bacterium]|jgi:hypothetical protein